MKVILGLGNPGREYEQTRHNVGWWVLDHLADVWRFDGWRKDGEALVSNGLVGPHKVRLVKPQTYYNLSGAALRPYLRRPFWAPMTDLLVVCDDVALPVGRFRLRPRGSAGGSTSSFWAPPWRGLSPFGGSIDPLVAVRARGAACRTPRRGKTSS